MKRVTFVFIGLIVIVAFLATSQSNLEKEVVQVEKVSLKKQPTLKIYE